MAKNLFKVYHERENLSEIEARAFHNVMDKLTRIGKRAHPQIQTTVDFLTTRIKDTDNDDQKKLVSILKYLYCTAEIVLTLSSEIFNVVKCWVDGSYAVHPDMQSHTGENMSMGESYILKNVYKSEIECTNIHRGGVGWG